jgi:hypothetical protein
MLRTVEALFMVVITFGAMLVVTNYVYIPPPRITSSIGQQEYAQDLLQRIDENKALTNAVFSESNEGWSSITKTLVDILPPNVVFNITAYKISEVSGTLRYISVKNGSNFNGVFPSGSVSVSYVMTSPEATVTQTPEKIGYKAAGGKQMYTTLYILNCADANGWWITGYTGESLALDAYKQMSPYFETTVLVNSTADFERLLNGTSLTGSPDENVEGAIIINTFGECVPIPESKVSTYMEFTNYLGKRTALYNWTWVSIVGYPFYYVSNTAKISGDNSWGIYGMSVVAERGLYGFLDGLEGRDYTGGVGPSPGSLETNGGGVVYYTDILKEDQNYYGIYPGHQQTATRPLPKSYLNSFNMVLPKDKNLVEYTNIFLPNDDYYAGATWTHKSGGVTKGSFLALGLARTPDLKVAIIGILAVYRPSIYRSDFSVTGTTRIVTLQLGQLGAS